MSLNIPQNIVDVSARIDVVIDTASLGPRQIKALERMLITGHIKGHGVPAVVAKAVRLDKGMPTLHFRNRKSFAYSNMTDPAFFERLEAARVAEEMKEKFEQSGRWRLKAIEEAISKRKSSVNYLYTTHETFKHVFAKFELPSCSSGFERYITINAKGVL